MIQATTVEPFITNDAAGYARMAFAYVLGMGPLFGLVVWFLRRGPDQAIATLQNDLNGLGTKVNTVTEAQERDREDRLALRKEIVANQREVIDRIHLVATGMTRVEERCDIATSFERLGERIENVVVLAVAKRT